ncbi:MAG: c-type cytochrome [Thiolinea sp.]
MSFLLKPTRIVSCTFALLVVGSTTLAASEDVTPIHPGNKVYQSACMVCHVAKGKPTIAPPIFAVKNHVIAEYPERDDFIQRVKSWVKAPNEEEALMRGAIRKFGLMPAMPQLSDDDLQAVAEYLFDTNMELPEWYKKHYEEEHGTPPETPSSDSEEG